MEEFQRAFMNSAIRPALTVLEAAEGSSADGGGGAEVGGGASSAALERTITNHTKITLFAIFDHFDTDRSGALEQEELLEMLKTIYGMQLASSADPWCRPMVQTHGADPWCCLGPRLHSSYAPW
jgi:hypothetical protein